MFDRSASRRRMLKLAGSATLIGLAGCTTGAQTGSQRAGRSPTETHHEETTTTPTDGHAHHQHHDGHHHEEVPHEPADHVEVGMITTDGGEYHFAPHLAWVKPGGTITWVNESGRHTTTAYAPKYDKPRRIPAEAEPWDSGLYTEAGETFERAFEVEGVYDYYCVPHEQFGMLGTVIVGEPELHGQPGMEPPKGSLPSKAQRKLTDLNGMVEEALGHHE